MGNIKIISKIVEQLRHIRPYKTGLKLRAPITEGNLLKSLVNLFDLLTAVPIPNTAFVSPDGDDSTGALGNLKLPFLTIQAARNAASSGDLVHVFPGVYATANTSLTKNGVNYHFCAGAIVNASGGIFQGAASDFTITGKGEFTCSSGHVYHNNNTGMRCSFTAKFARSDDERTIRSSFASGLSIIEIDKIESSVSYAAVFAGGISAIGRTHVRNSIIEQDSGVVTGNGPVMIDQIESTIIENCDIICNGDDAVAVTNGQTSPQTGNVHFRENRIYHYGTGGSEVGIFTDGGSGIFTAGSRFIFEGSNQIYMENGTGSSINYGNSGVVVLQQNVHTNLATTGSNVPIGAGAVVVDAGFTLRPFNS